MKKVFELHVNGKFSHYLKPSETKLLNWDADIQYKLIPVQISPEKYRTVFGLV